MHQRRKGFTLVELLVVIGIIALLISILLPALSAARRAAAAVKCSTALREIGNAFRMYEQDYKGYAPAARIYFDAGTYEINGMTFNSGSNTDTTTTSPPFWTNFLAKYVTKSKIGGAGNASASDSAQQLKSIFWACPAWDPYTNAAGPAGINITQFGYGMNGFPEYTSSFPASGEELGESTNYTDAPSASQQVDTPRWKDSFTTNRWYKLNKWTHPTERALVGDTLFWFMEARPSQINSPPNPWLVGEQNLANALTWTGTNPGNQTTFDYYRHGRYPALKPSGAEFATTGGKMSYNVLFADGHVTTLIDRPSAYRAVRMRFPG